ncbi:MAG: K(+)-insensitive pyrophosphate-energized proton pump [Candidatus Thorarchaeota archaeon]|nr:MAG: K(+)-insensitive pyrophosphate-energized proton pump [Candidatus Thorarchaeota archaeon]
MSALIFLAVTVLSGILSILVAIFTFRKVMAFDEGDDKMREVSHLIEEGAYSFIKIQYRILTLFTIILAILLGIVFGQLGIPIAISYILGSFASMSAGYIGIIVATRANRRTAAAAIDGIGPSFNVAFKAGSVMGLMIAGIALAGLSTLYLIWDFLLEISAIQLWEVITGFSFGASTVALFAKAGGGIFTKTADLAADIVGKIEHHIPEDDPRNPAAIADAVGDNVGDVAGTGADIFDSNVAAILAAAILGAAIDAQLSLPFSFGLLPLLIASLGAIASVIGVFTVNVEYDEDPGPALNYGTYLTTLLFAIFSIIVIYLLGLDLLIAIVAIVGLLAGVFIGFTSDVFTSDRGLGFFKPVPNMVESAQKSAANLVLSGYSYGLLSAVPSVLVIATSLVTSFILGSNATTLGLGGWEGGLYAVSIAAVGLLSTNGMIMSSDAYGPIVDNARGVIEQSDAGEEAIIICDKLDASGNTAKAITKGFAIGASAISVLALFAAFIESAIVLVGEELVVNLADPFVLAGAFIGSLMPVTFSAILILGVGKNSERMIAEIRRQFREDPGILEGTSEPDYESCISIATSGALKELLPGTILAISVTILTGVFLGLSALAGYLGGAVLVGLIMALLMGNAGGAWDNAKKIIESPESPVPHDSPDYHEVHDNAVLGDMIGDPFKDTAGPSINTLLVVISLTATLFLPVIAGLHLWLWG